MQYSLLHESTALSVLIKTEKVVIIASKNRHTNSYTNDIVKNIVAIHFGFSYASLVAYFHLFMWYFYACVSALTILH